MDESRLRILLVDDDEDCYVITRDLLSEIEGTCYELDWVDNYAAALEKLGQNRHDVCLFDYRLGERDGLDLLGESIANGCKAPIILLTGQGDREVDLRAMKAGAADFLAKGDLTPQLLERSIRYSIERNRVERKLAHLAQYDPLTGLPNRVLFQDRLRQTMALARREGRQVGLLFIDLDHFKVVNDTLGHSAGDALLQETAARLTRCIRECDTIARLGGDEFVVIVSVVARPQSAAHIAQRIIEVMASPFDLDGNEVFVAASIGIALYPSDGNDVENLVKNADAAMYQAKESGRNTYRFFSREVHAKAMDRLTLESGLRHALERKEFLLHYQPQFDLKSGRMIGGEALLRWQPGGKGMVGADRFIPILEETGLIVPVGEWVLRTACAQNRSWRDAGFPPLRVAVNLSVRQLRQPDLPDVMATVLKETELDPACLELELTESTVMQNIPENVGTLGRLKEMGISLAIDDFGTGYSSLSRLKDLPIDRLKIDCSFIRHIGAGRGDEAIARAIIALAHSLNMKVVAEGVETKEQLDFLREHDCDEAQGFYLGRPAPVEEFARLLEKAG